MAKNREKEFVSTGQAAELCSVTADTVLKWIKSGRIHANRTPGGHYRIRLETLHEVIDSDNLLSPPEDGIQPFQFCWEFYGKKGEFEDRCRECVVYRSRTMRCYEMIQLPTESGHIKLYCKGSCDDCEYFRVVQGQRINVLVITEQKELKNNVETQVKKADFKLRVTNSEYHCSMVIENFRPDYVVIDSSIGPERCRIFTKHLFEDPRIPYVKIIVAGENQEIPSECKKMIFAIVTKSFNVKELENFIKLSRQESIEKIPRG